MLSKLILFIATKFGTSALIIELILGTAAVAGGYVLIKRHDAKVAEEWQQVGVQQGMDKMKVIKEAEWKTKYDSIAAEKAANETVLHEIEVNKQIIEKLRAQAEALYEKNKTEAHVKIVEIPAKVAEIPPDKLIDSMRVQSAVLDNKLPESVQPTGKLVEPEERKMLEQLEELGIRRVQVDQYESNVEEFKKDNAMALANCAKEVDAQKTNITICQHERDTALDKANYFENAYKIVTAKRSKSCTFWKWVTLGIHKCH